MNFKLFCLDRRIEAGIESEGYDTPTPIQVKAIGPVMEGRDVMGLAQTGSGKTAAFALPILNHLLRGKMGRPRALIVAPTRELAEQIHQAIVSLGRHTRIRSMSVYGGVSINTQAQKLKRGVAIVVGCPGRLLDHLNRGNLDVSGIQILVLDEADHMFDMGFLPDIKKILARLPKRRQTLLFSATMPREINALAREVLFDPVEVRIDAGKPAKSVRHALFPVEQKQKTAALMQILKDAKAGPVLVFTRTKHRAKRLGVQLTKAGHNAASIQGNLSQNKRQAALDGFKSGRYRVLVATDIAARGIDVAKVSHVINFDMPDTAEAYIHRIGRTGRAAYTGEAFTFFTNEDKQMVRAIDRVLGGKVQRRVLEGLDKNNNGPVTAESRREADSFDRPDTRPWKGPKRQGAKKSWPKSGRRGAKPAIHRQADPVGA